MSCYASLAQWYDALTGDVPYTEFADFYETELRRGSGEFHLLLDFCCGTGTLTWELARRGYEMIGVDSSVDMLIQAQSKYADGAMPPLFLCQDAASLDLFGTVDAAVCSLDGVNYIPPEKLPEAMHRLSLFIRPGGLLIFDIRTPDFLRSLDGQVFVDEKEDVLCLWRAELDEALGALVYGMDIFSRSGRKWDRESEEHTEYIYEPETLRSLLEAEGFADLRFRSDAPQGDAGRMFIIAARR